MEIDFHGPVELLEEVEENGKKFRKVGGVALVHNHVSENGWHYTPSFNRNYAKRANELIKKGKKLTMRSIHKPGNHVLSTVGRLTEMKEKKGIILEDGSKVDGIVYEGLVLTSTTEGKDMVELLESKLVNGVSIRATKPIKFKKAKIDGREAKTLLEATPAGLDFTDDPSIEAAYAELLEEADDGSVNLEASVMAAEALEEEDETLEGLRDEIHSALRELKCPDQTEPLKQGEYRHYLSLKRTYYKENYVIVTCWEHGNLYRIDYNVNEDGTVEFVGDLKKVEISFTVVEEENEGNEEVEEEMAKGDMTLEQLKKEHGDLLEEYLNEQELAEKAKTADTLLEEKGELEKQVQALTEEKEEAVKDKEKAEEKATLLEEKNKELVKQINEGRVKEVIEEVVAGLDGYSDKIKNDVFKKHLNSAFEAGKIVVEEETSDDDIKKAVTDILEAKQEEVDAILTESKNPLRTPRQREKIEESAQRSNGLTEERESGEERKPLRGIRSRIKS